MENLKRDIKTLGKDIKAILKDVKDIIYETVIEPVKNAGIEVIIFVWDLHEIYLEYKEKKHSDDIDFPQCVLYNNR